MPKKPKGLVVAEFTAVTFDAAVNELEGVMPVNGLEGLWLPAAASVPPPVANCVKGEGLGTLLKTLAAATIAAFGGDFCHPVLDAAAALNSSGD